MVEDTEQDSTLEQAIAEFNQQEFYACHDILEAIWMDAFHPDKAFYQGLLQIAVGLYHLTRLNWRGAVILLGEGISRLRHYQPSYMNIEVSELIIDSAELLARLQNTGADNIANFWQSLESGTADLKLPKIRRY